MEFTIENVVYRAGKLDAFQQLHIVRRLTPCLARIAAAAGPDTGGSGGREPSVRKDVPEGDEGKALDALLAAIATLKDEDVDFVLNSCLDVTERKQPGGGWARMRSNGALMFQGISLACLLQIAWHVIRENMADFFAGLPSLSALEGMAAKIGESRG
jgi:hypothetical protein